MNFNKNIWEREVGLFVENNIDKYRVVETATLIELIQVFANNKGFVVIKDKDNKTLGHLEIEDTKHLVDLLKNNEKETIKNLVKSKKIELRKEIVNENEKLRSILQKFKSKEESYFLVVDNENFLLGRVSPKIISDKIEKRFC